MMPGSTPSPLAGKAIRASHAIASDLAVVVPSCDAYSDVWPFFFDAFFDRWKDCPFPVYLVSNSAEFPHPRVAALRVGEDKGWSANLKSALREVPQAHVLLVIEDLFPADRIDTDRILSLLNEVGDFDYLRLNPSPGPRRAISDRVGLVPPGDVYRTSTVYSIWRKSVLSSLLVEHESAWEFELNGSERSDRFGRWFASRAWLVPYVNLIVKRKVDPVALARLRRSGLVVQSARTTMSTAESAWLRLKAVRSWVFALLPWRLQRRIRGTF